MIISQQLRMTAYAPLSQQKNPVHQKNTPDVGISEKKDISTTKHLIHDMFDKKPPFPHHQPPHVHPLGKPLPHIPPKPLEGASSPPPQKTIETSPLLDDPVLIAPQPVVAAFAIKAYMSVQSLKNDAEKPPVEDAYAVDIR